MFKRAQHFAAKRIYLRLELHKVDFQYPKRQHLGTRLALDDQTRQPNYNQVKVYLALFRHMILVTKGTLFLGLFRNRNIRYSCSFGA